MATNVLGPIAQARFFPELLPFTFTENVPVGTVEVFSLTELKRRGYLVRLAHLRAATGALTLTARADGELREASTSVLAALTEDPGFDQMAQDHLMVHLQNATGSALTSSQLRWGLWVSKPTAADKLALGLPLTSEEARIAQERGLADTVEKGQLPYPLPYLMLREYYTLRQTPIAQRYTSISANTEVTLASMIPAAGECLVLAGIAATAAAARATVFVNIDRDDQDNYLSLDAYALVGTAYLPAFIPAVSRLRIRISSTVALTNYDASAIVKAVRLTNILKARWGIDSTPTEVREAVKGGIV